MKAYLVLIVYFTVRCAIDHPYHVLPKVFALVNAYKDEIYPKDAKQKTNNTISSSPRTEAATNLLQQLKTNRKLRDIIMQMDTMCEGIWMESKIFCFRFINATFSIGFFLLLIIQF